MVSTSDILFNANKVLTTLTKVRFVKSLNRVEPLNIKFYKIYSWPLPFERDKKVLKHLNDLGIIPENNIYVKSSKVSYDIYSKLEKINVVNIIDLRWLKSCIDIFRIINNRKKFSGFNLSIAYDPERGSEFLPLNVGDSVRLRGLSKRSDVMLLFNNVEANFQAKIQGHLGYYIFSDLSLFKGKTFELKSRKDVVSKTVSKGDRSERMILTRNSSNSFQKLVDITSERILKVLPKELWVDELRNITNSYWKEKY